MEALRDVHEIFGYVVIAANGAVGLAALVAWRAPTMRGRWLWIATGAAEIGLMVQVVLGVALTAGDRFVVDGIHQFYGFLAFATVGLVYSYRAQMRGRLELLYGCAGLFLTGLGIRAVLEVMA